MGGGRGKVLTEFLRFGGFGHFFLGKKVFEMGCVGVFFLARWVFG